MMNRGMLKNIFLALIGIFVLYTANSIEALAPVKMYLNIAFALFIVWSVFRDYVLKYINAAGVYLCTACNTEKGMSVLDSKRKLAIFPKARKQVFILDCYGALDMGNEEQFGKFVDANSQNYLLKDKGCSLTFEYVLLQFFFFTGEYDKFNSAYKRITEADTQKRGIKLNENVKSVLDIASLITKKKYADAAKAIKKIDLKTMNKRSRMYFYLMQTVMYKDSGDNSELKHAKSLIEKEEIKIPFINNLLNSL